MSSLTRWVLAHKRTVVLAWVVLTIAGVMASGPATDALDPEFSVPNKEGWETNQTIAQKYRGTGGDTMPLVPVVKLPEGTRADSPSVRADLAKMDRSLEKALPGSRLASYASTDDKAFLSDDGRTTFALVYPPPDPDSAFGENPSRREGGERGAEGRDGRGPAGAPDGLRRAVRGQRRGQRGPRTAARGRARRARRARGADVRVRVVPGDRPDLHGGRLDHDHLPAAARASPSSRRSPRSCSS